jgi:glucosylceramidase
MKTQASLLPFAGTQILSLMLVVAPTWAAVGPSEFWLTDPSGSARFEKQQRGCEFRPSATTSPLIQVDETRRFQVMDGFGFTLTGGSAQHLIRMGAGPRAAILEELFGTNGTGIGTSYLRVSIGASDLNERVFSYDDLPPGETDPAMSKFDLGPDRKDVIPVLKEILGIQPALKIMGSPWSAPPWMKTNNDTRGGRLKPVCFAAYARYLAKYVEAMKAEGIRIDAITVQNEPLHPGNNPSMFMPAEEQADFVKNHLGQTFKKADLDTKIIIYDHNADRPDYPLTILKDPGARQFVDGSAFHLYAGKIETLSAVHDAYPDKNLYFTEQWIGAPGNLKGDLAWHTKNLIVGAPRNWCRTVLEWNLAADSKHQPHTDRGGCDRCLGAVTIDGNQVKRNPGYYIIAHAAKFVRPGSERIFSSEIPGLPNVAFRTPEGRRVLIVLNEGRSPWIFAIGHKDKMAECSLNPGAVGTWVW